MKRFVLAGLIVFFSSSLTAQTSTLQRYIAGTGGTLTDTLDNGTIVTLDLSTDDVEQENNEVDSYYDDDLDCGWEGDPSDQNVLTLGLRFIDLNILQGSTIDSAFVVFHAHEGKSAADVAQIVIQAEATDNAVTFDQANFNDNYLLTDRPLTAASVNWTVAEDWVIWQPYKTADIGSLIQEVVDRPGWQSGNAIALILQGQNQGASTVENAREFTSYENIADPDDVDPQGNPGDGTNHPERRPYLLVYVNGPLSTSEHLIEQVSTFPNPVVDGQLHITLEKNAPATVEFFTMGGQKVRSFQTEGTNITLDISDLAPQAYLFQLTQEGESMSQTILVE